MKTERENIPNPFDRAADRMMLVLRFFAGVLQLRNQTLPDDAEAMLRGRLAIAMAAPPEGPAAVESLSNALEDACFEVRNLPEGGADAISVGGLSDAEKRTLEKEIGKAQADFAAITFSGTDFRADMELLADGLEKQAGSLRSSLAKILEGRGA